MGGTVRHLGPVRFEIAAPREVVFEVIDPVVGEGSVLPASRPFGGVV
jgi:hypothetical protein